MIVDDEAEIAKVMATTGIDRAGAEQALADGRRLAAEIVEAAGDEDGDPAPRKKRKLSRSPSSRCLEVCRKRGWSAGVVERFVRFPPPGHRVDLFGVIDIVAVTTVSTEGKDPVHVRGVLGIQASPGSVHAAHAHKIRAAYRDDEDVRAWFAAGNRLELWSWSLRGAAGKAKRWSLRVERFEARDGALVGIEDGP